jgi:predicted O-methyltransferase YrrM
MSDFTHLYGLSFAGQITQHNFYTYHVISRVLAANPQVKSIIEFGTGHGALTLYLKLWAARLGVEIHTFDVHPFVRNDGVEVMFERLGIHYHIMSITDEPAKQLIKTIIAGKPTYIVCDNGNKPLEFATYAPFLPQGSVISAHDWGVAGEIRPQDVEQVVAKHGLVPFEPEEGIRFDTAFGTWIKK